MTRQWGVRCAFVAAVLASWAHAGASPRKEKKVKPEIILWASPRVAIPSYDPDDPDRADAKAPTAKVRLRLTILNADEELWGAGQVWEWDGGREYAEPDVEPFSEANPADIARQTFREKVFRLPSGTWRFVVRLVKSDKIVGRAETTIEVK